ncbi:ABC transporter substrate-binding protein [Maritimibacter alkaliphilus]|uniref:ABC transporter substrate-binding protein n=1 Tax=Maritimibacter alkaliphilus TaxID=404236 RepID=UPI001C95018C|nr:ABC transporter substrate-binding protein [Maritimibacter alkaliphilus]MBY6091623.1 ABC transporter substrate-binding protein [Maritimibacter alkaliphilus]
MPRILALLALLLAPLAAAAQDFPLTVTHKYGTTEIPAQPQRVVTLSFLNHDNLLAIGVTPVGLRDWFGNQPSGVWPWAQDALGEARPTLLKGDINFEQIAALKPDLIEAMWSGISRQQYEMLSRIAPVVPPLEGYEDYGMPWQLLARTTGLITGHAAEAEAQVKAIEDRAATLRASHPDWQGATATVAYLYHDAPGAYTSKDIRSMFLDSLGFRTPQAVDDVSGAEAFAMTLSNEDLTPLDADLLLWFVSPANVAAIRDLALRPELRAHTEGREVAVDALLASAFSHASLLSLPYVLDRMVPMIEAALDGDPATPVPSSVEAGLAP